MTGEGHCHELLELYDKRIERHGRIELKVPELSVSIKSARLHKAFREGLAGLVLGTFVQPKPHPSPFSFSEPCIELQICLALRSTLIHFIMQHW